MKTTKLTHLKKLLEHAKYYNLMAPFPVYDTEWVENLRIRIKEMEDNKHDYDQDPVWACKYCKKLHIITDDDGNDICFRCGAVNELTEFKDIYEYNAFIDANKNT